MGKIKFKAMYIETNKPPAINPDETISISTRVTVYDNIEGYCTAIYDHKRNVWYDCGSEEILNNVKAWTPIIRYAKEGKGHRV